MAIKSFKDIIDNKGYRINSNDRKIFEEGTLESFFGFGEKDAIEFIVYDANDNQLPQINDELVRYIPLTSENIREYFLIPEGTLFQKYQFPNEYFVDVERLLRESGYDNGIFKTQITLLNKRVGSNNPFDKLWISEISPSRTEIRVFPLKKGIDLNPELQKRYDLFIRNGQFRDDTINLAINFLEKITPTVIDTFLQNKYSEKWFNKLIGEYKIQDFDIFSQKVYEKFVEASIFHFTNRISNPNDINYGKPKRSKPDIELSVEQIKDLCKTILIYCIDFYLLRPDFIKEASFDKKEDDSTDVVNKVLQRLQVDTVIDTTIPEVKIKTFIKPEEPPKDIVIKKKILEQIKDIIDFPPKPDVEVPIDSPPNPKDIWEDVIYVEMPPKEPDISVKDPDIRMQDYVVDTKDFIISAGGGGGNIKTDINNEFNQNTGIGFGGERDFMIGPRETENIQ